MSKQRIVKDEIWDDDWFYELDPSEKLVWLFLLTNPRGNIAGIYKLNKKWASQATGLDFDVFNTILSRLVKDGKIVDCESWIGLTNFHKHLAYRNASVAQGIVRLYKERTGCPQALDSLWVTLLNSTLLNLSASEDKSSQIRDEIKQILMGWKPHNENDHTDDIPAIDADSGEKIRDRVDEEKEENKKITHNLGILGEARGKRFLDIPTQRNFYKRLLTAGLTHKDIGAQFMDLIEAPYWREKKDQLPDLKSLYSIVKNKT